MPAVQYSQEFTISIVVGKDVVPRIGLHQMESLRADLINAIKRSKDPKVRIVRNPAREKNGSQSRTPFLSASYDRKLSRFRSNFSGRQ